MKEKNKTHLTGEMEVHDGRAPRAGWAPVSDDMTRTEDIWLAGDPLSLPNDRDGWRKRLEPPRDLGLRIRFVLREMPFDAFSFLELVSSALALFPDEEEWLYLHAELMEGPEPGVYLAFDNRPPALVTQLHLEKERKKGELEAIPEGPLHVNVLFHDCSVDLKAVVVGNDLKELLEDVGSTHTSFQLGRIHELSLARSESELTGVSVGVEAVRQDQGAEGGSRVG